VTREDLHRALHELHRKPAREIAHDYDCPVERARLLAAGAVILVQVLARYNLDEASVKPNGIRGGLVVSYARHQDGWRQALPIPPAVP
jgi:exopolyphosphatase/pppGpp-phosphohydrolase